MPRSPFDYEDFGRAQAAAQAHELMNVIRARLQEVATNKNAAEEAATVSSEDERRGSEQNSSAVSPSAVSPLDRAILEPPPFARLMLLRQRGAPG